MTERFTHADALSGDPDSDAESRPSLAFAIISATSASLPAMKLRTRASVSGQTRRPARNCRTKWRSFSAAPKVEGAIS